MKNQNELPADWLDLASSADFKTVLAQHFAYLVDSPGYQAFLDAIIQKVHKVEIDSEKSELIVHFPGNEKLVAGLPAKKVSKKLPLSYQKLLAVHENLYLENAMLSLGDHGMFNEGDGWFDALRDEDSDLVGHDLNKIISPMMDYSDLWLYHPGETNSQGESVLYYLSHEGGDIDNPQDCNLGSLFLRRVAENLDIEIEAPQLSKTLEPSEWYDSLDADWKTAFAKMDIESAKDAKKAFKLSSAWANEEFPIRSLDALIPLGKLTSIRVESKVLEDISALKNFARLESLDLSSQADLDLSVLAFCPKLKRLDLSGSSIRSLDFVKYLPKLERLEINNTAISDLEPLVGCKKLEEIEISKTKVTKIDALPKIKSLRNIDLSHTHIEDISPLSTMKNLSTINLDGTPVRSLKPLYPCKKVHILHADDVNINFEEILRYRAQATMGKGEDDWLSLDIYHYSINGSPDRFLADLKLIDYPLDGLATELGTLVNDKMLGCLKSKEAKYNSLAVPILETFLALPWTDVEPKILDELAGNALVPLVSGRVSATTEALIFDRLVRKDTKSYRLLYNLACYYASKNDKARLLEFTAASINQGQDRTKFSEDSDFKAFQSDPDFRAIIEKNLFPDPETDPAGWWNAMSDEWQGYFWDFEFETKEELLTQLHRDDFSLYLESPRTLDPLKGLTGLKELTIRDIRTKNLSSLSGLTGLVKFECEFDQYGGKIAIESIDGLADSKQLKQIRMPGHPLVSIDVLTQLDALEYMYLKCVNPVSSTIFAKMKHLESVLLDAPLDSLAGFSELKKIHYLRLTQCSDKKGFDLKDLAGLENLSDLHIVETKISSIMDLVGLKKLANLYVSKRYVSDEDVTAFRQALPGCDLDLSK